MIEPADRIHTEPAPVRRLPRPLRALSGPAILLALSILFCWKILLTNQYTWLDTGDIVTHVLPWWQFQADEIHHGRIPLWDPYQWAGQPLIGQAQPGLTYPINWIVFSLPLHNGWLSQKAMHWYYALIRFLAACFCYLLCRDLGRSKAAAILAGCVFGFSGYVGNNDWPQMLNGAIWTPLIILFILRATSARRPYASAALGGLFLGMAWLSGHHQMPILVTLITGVIWAYFIFRYRFDWPM